MATKSKRHIHKYHQVQLGPGNKVWACALPDCQHHMPPHYSKLVEGKMSYCWGCDELIILNPVNMKMDKPLCESCMPELTNLTDVLNQYGV